jgi:hypothetical protein
MSQPLTHRQDTEIIVATPGPRLSAAIRRDAHDLDLTQIEVNVYVNTDDQNTAERIFAAVDDLASALGFDGPFEVSVRRGSVYRRSIARLRRGFVEADVAGRLAKMERALEIAQLDRRQAEVDEKQAAAASQLLDSLKDVTEACIRVGSILVVKYLAPQGHQRVFVRTMSPLEVHTWERFPEIQTHPQKALEMLATAVASLEPAQVESGSTSGLGT